MNRFPSWMHYFHRQHGVWPIAGGSDIGVNIPAVPPQENPPEEIPPATPAPTHAVDPGAFNRGATEQHPAPTPQPTNPPEGQGRVFTSEEVERIRKEEKDKLYGRVDTLTEEIKRLREEAEARKAAEAAEEDRIAQQQTLETENQTDVRELLRKKESEWTMRFNEIEAEREKDRALLEKEREFSALRDYQSGLLEQHADDIIPELRDTIGGSTREEVEASVQRAVEKTQAILANIQAAQQEQLRAVPTSTVTQPGAGGPMETAGQNTQTLSADDIRNMDMSAYAQMRPQLRQAASRVGPYSREA